MKDLNNKIYLFPFLLILVVLLFMFLNTDAKDAYSSSIQDLRIQTGIDYNSLPVYNISGRQQYAQSNENVELPVVSLSNSTNTRSAGSTAKSYSGYSADISSQSDSYDSNGNSDFNDNPSGLYGSSKSDFQTRRSRSINSEDKGEAGYMLGNLLTKSKNTESLGSKVLLTENSVLASSEYNQELSILQKKKPPPIEPPAAPVGNGLWVLLLLSCGYLYVIKKRNIKSVEE